jgi:glycosyltransferase involved in cell wall biosynthesis
MDLTIAIITKNRPKELQKCLTSILRQDYAGFEVLVLDNDPRQTAKKLCDELSKNQAVPIRYVSHPVPGYSSARNAALRECRTRYLGFVDDDCILVSDWADCGIKTIKEKQSAFVVGKSVDLFQRNIFVQVHGYIYKKWMPDYYDKQTGEISHFRLDTKNLILDMEILRRLSIFFDERFNRYGGEDVDFGLELKKRDIKGHFSEKMLLYHRGKLNYKAFVRKAFNYGYNCYNLHIKWAPFGECQTWNYYQDYIFYIDFEHFKNDYRKIEQKNRLKKISYFVLIKLFNHFYLKGFFSRKNDPNFPVTVNSGNDSAPERTSQSKNTIGLNYVD